TISAPGHGPGPITNRSGEMTELDMNPTTLPAAAQALYEKMAARRQAHGEGFGGPYLALLNHPELARRIEELGFFLKFEGARSRTRPVPISNGTTTSHTRAPPAYRRT